MTSPERKTAAGIARDLQARGHIAWFAGGCVRDELLGRQPKDYDVATDAVPDQVKEIFPNALEVGASFGVMLVRRDGFVIEVATFREDGGYVDGRHPEEVRFTDAATDAQRRDFTINGLFLDPCTEEVHDFVDGRADIAARVLRAIGDPEARFEEDHLRLLRAVRFAAAMSLDVDDTTRHAIERRASNLAGVSRERVGDELRLMLMGPDPVAAVTLIQDWGLDAPMFGERSTASTFPRLTATVAQDHPLAARLAALSMDRAAQGDAVSTWREGVMLSNQERDGMRACLDLIADIRTWSSHSVAQRKRLAADDWFASALSIFDGTDAHAAIQVGADVAELAKTGLAPARLVSGDDLIAAGIMPGPGLGQILEQVYDAQLEGRVDSRDVALSLARDLAERG